MIAFAGKLILLDIEGTTSPLAYVHEVMFPFVRRHTGDFLAKNWTDERVRDAVNRLLMESGHGDADESGHTPHGQILRVVGEVTRLMDNDVKAAGLKQLQGLIWEQGFGGGELRGTLFPDVVEAIDSWRAVGVKVKIYSSGSILAQRLFFGHTDFGNLLDRLSGFYDTSVGSKRVADSYAAIAEDAGLSAGEILFVSDSIEELNAAAQSGMKTALALRPGNPPVPLNPHPSITSFLEISVA